MTDFVEKEVDQVTDFEYYGNEWDYEWISDSNQERWTAYDFKDDQISTISSERLLF